MDSLVKSRGYVRARVTKLCNKIENTYNSMFQHEISMNIIKLFTIRKELEQANMNIRMQPEFDETK